MRLSSARSSAEERPRVLVLGSGCTARRIAEDLGNLGCQVRSASLPELEDGEPLNLKAWLAEEIAALGRGGGGRVWVHPGVTEWAWRPEIQTVAQELGAGTIAPAPRLVNLFSNRLSLFSEAEKLGIPHPALGLEPVQSEREVEARLGPAGFPAVLKSVSCHGEDAGIRVMSSPEELYRELPIWQEQLRRSGSGALLLAEKYIEGARALTVPFARFKDGSFLPAPIVDSSLMTRQRRTIEFCPAEKVDSRSEAKIWEAVRALTDGTGFVGVGSLEFLADGSRIWLVGGNPSVGTNYPLWEKIAQASAVQWQMATLMEESAPPQTTEAERRHSLWGAGVLVRIHAEDPVLRIPQPGRIIERIPAEGPSVVAATAFSEARTDFCDTLGTIPPDSDGLVATVLAGAKSRRQAVEYCKTVLSGLWIAGGLQTNLRMQQEVLDHPWVREGVFHAGFLDEDFVPQLEPPLPILNLFQKCARALQKEAGGSKPAVWSCGFKRLTEKSESEHGLKGQDDMTLKWAAPPRTWTEFGHGMAGMKGTVGRLAEATQNPDGLPVCFCPVGAGVWRVQIGPFSRLVRRTDAETISPDRRERPFYSQMSGRVHALLYREGRVVGPGEPLIVIESLRQLVPLSLPGNFRLKQWHVKPDAEVAFGERLATVELST